MGTRLFGLRFYVGSEGISAQDGEGFDIVYEAGETGMGFFTASYGLEAILGLLPG
jgi:hypothetical protein